MSRDIQKLVISQGIANLADVFFRVIVIANVFVLIWFGYFNLPSANSDRSILLFSQFLSSISNEEISFKSCSFLDSIW